MAWPAGGYPPLAPVSVADGEYTPPKFRVNCLVSDSDSRCEVVSAMAGKAMFSNARSWFAASYRSCSRLSAIVGFTVYCAMCR